MRMTNWSMVVVACVVMGAIGCEKKLAGPKPDAIRLEADANEVSADDGVLAVTAAIYEKGVLLRDVTAKMTLTLTDGAGAPVAGITQAPLLVSDALGEVRHSYANLRTASSGTVLIELFKDEEATVPFVDASAQPVIAQLAVRVLSGAPAVVNAALSPSPATILPNEEITVAVTVRDAYDNLTEGAVQIQTDAPGALLVGNKLTSITAQGTYEVVASIVGTSIFDKESFNVGHASASTVVLSSSKSALQAGTTIDVSAQVFDSFGNLLPTADAPVTFDVLGLAGETFTAAPNDPNSGSLSVLNAAGSYTLEAKLGGVNPPKDTEPLLISPAAASSIVLDAAGTTPNPLTAVPPGGAVHLAVTVRDAFSNVTKDPQSVTINAPGAVVQQGPSGTWAISGITQAGNYSIVATVAGIALTDLEPMVITPGANALLDLRLASSIYDAGQQITGMARVYDQYGNEINPPPTISIAPNIPGAIGAVAGRNVTIDSINRTGTFQVVATVDGTAISDPETVTIHDVSIPAVSLTVPVGQIDLSENQSVGIGLDYPTVVSGVDLVGTAEIQGVVTVGNADLNGGGNFFQLYPNNTRNAVATPTFRVNGGATFSTVQFVLRALDMSGNVSSLLRNVIIDPAANLHPSLIGSGITTRTIAEDTGGTVISDALDCRMNGAIPQLTLSDRNNGDVYRFDVPASLGQYVTVSTAAKVDTGANLASPRGIAVDSRNGDTYVMESGNDRLWRYPAGGGARIQVNTAAQPIVAGRHLEIATIGTDTLLFVVEAGVGNGRVRRYTINTPPASAISLGAGDLQFVNGNGNSNAMHGIAFSDGGIVKELFVSSSGNDRMQKALATASGTVTDFIATGLSSPRGAAVAPALPRFTGEVFMTNRNAVGTDRAPLKRVQPGDATTLATFQHGIDRSVDAAFCGGKLFVAYEANGGLDARVVEVTGF